MMQKIFILKYKFFRFENYLKYKKLLKFETNPKYLNSKNFRFEILLKI
jgi:hypothetical protein